MNTLSHDLEIALYARLLVHAILTMDDSLASSTIKQVDIRATDRSYPDAWKYIRPSIINSTFLHEAVIYSSVNNHNGNSLKIIEMLVDAGADVNAINSKGYSPLHNAAISNHSVACEYLVRHGAYLDQQSLKGYTPLQTASYFRSSDSVACLIRHGASLKLKNHRGEDALGYAVRCKHNQAIDLMMASTADQLAWMALEELEMPPSHGSAHFLDMLSAGRRKKVSALSL